MKSTLKSSLRGLVALLFVATCLVAVAEAQNREERLISARAGGVNLVSGDVKARRAGKADWETLSAKDDLKSGDTVRAGASGRVEVLLNPGSYLRAGEGAEFELTNASLDDLQIKLARGGAVVEATGYDGLDLSIVITTPQTSVRIVRGGVYRINVLRSGETEVAVEKGRAYVGESPEVLVKGGKVARTGASGVEVVKFDKKTRDALDEWSRERAHELARANDKLASRTTSALLQRASLSDFFKAEYASSPLGLWLWSARMGCYTFLPFYSDWRSPYGYWYGSWIMPFGYPRCYGCGGLRDTQPVIVNNGGTTTTYPSPSTTGSGGGATTGRTPTLSPAPTDRGASPVRERKLEPSSSPRPLDQ